MNYRRFKRRVNINKYLKKMKNNDAMFFLERAREIVIRCTMIQEVLSCSMCIDNVDFGKKEFKIYLDTADNTLYTYDDDYKIEVTMKEETIRDIQSKLMKVFRERCKNYSDHTKEQENVE